MTSSKALREQAQKMRYKAESIDERERAQSLRMQAEQADKRATELNNKASDNDEALGIIFFVIAAIIFGFIFLGQ